MSNNVKRRLSGIKQSLVTATQRVRTSRHGQPQTTRKRSVSMNKDGTVKFTSALVPMTEAREVRVAAGSTSTYGNPNTGGESAGKKSAKPKETR